MQNVINKPWNFMAVKTKIGYVVQNVHTHVIVLVCKTKAQAEIIAKKLNS